jgi:hypothetical protein
VDVAPGEGEVVAYFSARGATSAPSIVTEFSVSSSRL